MLENLLILAEGGGHEEFAIPPYYVGGGMFLVLLALLGITYLFSGLNQPYHDKKKSQQGETGPAHEQASPTHRSDH
jgi:hypothetical protein